MPIQLTAGQVSWVTGWAIVKGADLNWAPNRVGHFMNYYLAVLVTSQLQYIFVVSVPGVSHVPHFDNYVL